MFPRAPWPARSRRLRGPARMHLFGARAVGQVFHQAGRHAARESGRVPADRRRHSHQAADRRYGTEHTQHRCRVKSALLELAAREQAQPGHHLESDHGRGQDVCTRCAGRLACGKRSRNDDAAWVQGSRGMRVVIVHAVRHHAVRQARLTHADAKTARCPDRCWTGRGVVHRQMRGRRPEIVARAGQADADGVDEAERGPVERRFGDIAGRERQREVDQFLAKARRLAIGHVRPLTG
jgi:hypothetical protein